MPAPYSMGANDTGSAASLVTSVSVTTTAGDVIVVNIWSALPVTSVTDTKGNSYVPVNTSGGASQWVTTGKTAVLTNGVDTVTVTFSSAGGANVKLVGVPGAVYAPVDVNASASGTGTSLSVSTGVPPLGAGQIAIAQLASAAGTLTLTGSFTLLGSSHNLSPEFTITAYQTGVGASVTASATTGASGSWIAQVVTLQMTSFVNAAPNPPSQRAGTLATSADMNALANTALFLRTPPMVIAQSLTSGTGQSLTGGSATAVQYASLLRDTDGFFSTGLPTRLTVQTPGFYKVRYSIPFAVGGGNCQVFVRIQTGANNPAGAGVQTPFWYGFSAAANSIDGTVCGGGVMPFYFYAADFIQVMATVGTTSNMPVSPQAALVSMRMVST